MFKLHMYAYNHIYIHEYVGMFKNGRLCLCIVRESEDKRIPD